MAALTITAANVRPTAAKQRPKTYEVGEAITAGQVVYQDSTTDKVYLADAGVAAEVNAIGIAITNAASDGDFVLVVETVGIEPGATLTKGVMYYLGSSPGTIVPYADLIAGDTVVSLFRADSTSTALMDVNNTGIVL